MMYSHAIKGMFHDFCQGLLPVKTVFPTFLSVLANTLLAIAISNPVESSIFKNN